MSLQQQQTSSAKSTSSHQIWQQILVDPVVESLVKAVQDVANLVGLSMCKFFNKLKLLKIFVELSDGQNNGWGVAKGYTDQLNLVVVCSNVTYISWLLLCLLNLLG